MARGPTGYYVCERRGVHITDYTLGELVGRGAFGAVYLGQYRGREVALKVLASERVEARHARRLQEEARLLGLLRHRAIVTVHELVELDACWTVVMEYIRGIDLRVVTGPGPLHPGPSLEIVAEVAGALSSAFWARGRDGRFLHILHHDIKPSNILLTAAGEVKVVDFGLAAGEELGARGGTRGYLAPECYRSECVAASDVYSLGCVLYELLHGEPLPEARADADAHQRMVRRAVSSLEAEQDVVHLDVVELLEHMLHFEPAERPPIRDLEARCLDLRALQGGPFLREWAEAHVPYLHAGQGDTGAVEYSTEEFRSLLTAEETGSAAFDIVEATEEVPEDELTPPPGQLPEGLRSIRPSVSKVHASLGIDGETTIQEDLRPVIVSPTGQRLRELVGHPLIAVGIAVVIAAGLAAIALLVF